MMKLSKELTKMIDRHNLDREDIESWVRMIGQEATVSMIQEMVSGMPTYIPTFQWD